MPPARGRRHGSRPHFEDARPRDGSHDPARIVGCGRARTFRIPGIRQESLRRSHDDGAQARARKARHQSFDEVGLPGFQFIQDPLDYETRTHHSNIDVYDHLEISNLMQAAAILASFVYHAANREEMLPREPLPKPLSVIP